MKIIVFQKILDFTLLEPTHIDAEFLHNEFKSISTWLYDTTGIEIPESKIDFEIYSNPRGHLSVNGQIGYIGPLQRRGNTPRIKLDLTNDEKIVLKPEQRTIFHPYSDKINNKLVIMPYCYEEIFAEKLRALTERLRPRDLYDVVHLYLNKRWQPDQNIVFKSLQEKCNYKNIKMPTIDSLHSHAYVKELAAEWNNMLAHQISNLPPVEYYWKHIPEIINLIYGNIN